MIKDRQCPQCRGDMKLISVTEWGNSKKFDKYWICRTNYCKLKVIERGVVE